MGFVLNEVPKIRSSEKSFLTEWWDQYGSNLTMPNDVSTLTTPEELWTPKVNRKTPEMSPLTKYFEQTYHEVQGSQLININQMTRVDIMALESLVSELKLQSESDNVSSQNRDLKELSILRNDVRQLSSELEDKNQLAGLREEALLKSLKENHELVRLNSEKDELLEKWANEGENMQHTITQLTKGKEELMIHLSHISNELSLVSDDNKLKCQRIVECECTIGRLETIINEKDQQIYELKLDIDKLKQTIHKYDASRDDDVISTQPFIQKIHKLKQQNADLQSKLIHDIELLKSNYDNQIIDLRGRIINYELEIENSKRKFETVEAELTDTIRALNRKELQYSIIFQQNQEMIRERDELHCLVAQSSEKDVESASQSTTPNTFSTGPSSSEKESILMLTKQLDIIMNETERREQEWNQTRTDLDNLVQEWRLKANTAMTQVISLKEQTLHVLKEKSIMEDELAQNWRLIHQQRNEILDLQQIVESLAVEARRTTNDIHHPFSNFFPPHQGFTPTSSSIMSQQSENKEVTLSAREACQNRSSGDLSLSTWSQIIPKINKRRFEEEANRIRIDNAMFEELLHLQCDNQIISPKFRFDDNSRGFELPGKAVKFLIKLLLRLWRKSRGDISKVRKVSSLPPSRQAVISTITKLENTESYFDYYSTSSPPIQPYPPPYGINSIFDLMQQNETPTDSFINSGDLINRSRSGSSSIYQHFLSQNHSNSSLQSSFHSETQSDSPLLDDEEINHEENMNNFEEEEDVLSVASHHNNPTELSSFYISSASESDMSPIKI